MSLTTAVPRRELDKREGDGLIVRLLWEKDTQRTFVYVYDGMTQRTYEAQVAPHQAAHAFEHPFAFIK